MCQEICPQDGEGVRPPSRHPLGRHPPVDTPSLGRPLNVATEVDGAHPTGMHSCFHCVWRSLNSCRKTIVVCGTQRVKSYLMVLRLPLDVYRSWNQFNRIFQFLLHLVGQVLLRNSALLISIAVVGVLVAGYERRCAYVGLVITVRVLCLFHNNKSGCSWHVFIAETMYNLSMPNYCYWLPTVAPTDLTLRTDHTLH